ncbi:MAG: hypothetical protein WC756_12830 [Taibaiella sp.]
MANLIQLFFDQLLHIYFFTLFIKDDYLVNGSRQTTNIDRFCCGYIVYLDHLLALRFHDLDEAAFRQPADLDTHGYRVRPDDDR